MDETVQWIRQACHGVARAHDLGLLHNDIKPGNLFLDANGDAMVGEFGFASLLPIGSTAMVPPGATILTAAPEIAQHWGSTLPCASVRSDVYSLASTAFWMLAGRTAHDFSAAPNWSTALPSSPTRTLLDYVILRLTSPKVSPPRSN